MNDPIITLGQTELYQRLGDLRVKIIFIMVEKLSVNIRIGTDITDIYVTGIYLSERKLKQVCLGPLAILSARASDNLVISTAFVQQDEEHRDSNNIWEEEINPAIKLRVAGQTSIKPKSMQLVLVGSKGQALVYFEQDKQLARLEQLFFANVVKEVLPNRPIYTLVINSTNVEVHMPSA